MVAAPFEVSDIGTAKPRPLTDVLADYFSDDQFLLVLDNCEHVVGAVVNLVTALMGACDRLTILATSRRTLDLDGEIVYRVSPLGLAVSESGKHPEAVELFVDRLNLVDASHVPEKEELEAIAAIVARLDGLPLAIELAASRTKLLSPAQILERLSDRFRFLEGGRGGPERHETLLATMQWSYELLEPRERDALDRLSVFNGWSLEAAEALLGADAGELLERMVDKSLVDVSPRGAASRYRMLETVRQYANEHLSESGDENDTRLAHAEFFLDLAEKSDIGLRSSEQTRWLEIVRPEHDNIRAALGWALDSGRADLALRLVAATGRFWFMQTHWSEALRWFARASEIAGDDLDVLWARAFIKTGVIELITQGFPADQATAEKAHAILADKGDSAELAMATYALAEWQTTAEDAEALIVESLRLMDEAGDEWGKAYVQRWTGSKVELVGDPITSATHQQEALDAFRRLGDLWSAGWMAFDLGFSLLATEKYPEAKVAFDEALEVVEGINERLIGAHATRGLAAVAAGMNQNETARRLYLESIHMSERIGDVTCVAFASMNLAEVELTLDHNTDVTGLILEASEGFKSVRHYAGVAATYRMLARRALASGDTELSARLLGAAAAIPTVDRAELSPRERAALDALVGELERRLDDGEFDRLKDEGSNMSTPAIVAAMSAARGAPEAPPDPAPTRPEWPQEHRALLKQLEASWGLQDDIHIYRGLGGKSGAAVLAVDLTTRDFSGQAILKMEEGDWSDAADLESQRHELAWTNAPDFAEIHLPRVVHDGRWGRSSAILVTIASRGLEYTVPWADASYRAQFDTGSQLVLDLLSDWNASYRLAPSIMSPQSVLEGWLSYRLHPPRGRIHDFLNDQGVDPATRTYIYEGHWYPNPLAFALDPTASDKLGLRPIIGNIHGDLHGYNVLVRTGDQGLAWFLIDMAFYDSGGFLFFDHAYFELTHLLESRAAGPLSFWMPIIDGLSERSQIRGDDYGLIELLRRLRLQAWSWVEAEEPDRISSMQSQMFLARVAVGLNFAHKRVPVGLKSRGFLYSMAALKEYIKFHDIPWPRSGSPIILAGQLT